MYEGEFKGKGNGLQPLTAASNEEPSETLELFPPKQKYFTALSSSAFHHHAVWVIRIKTVTAHKTSEE